MNSGPRLNGLGQPVGPALPDWQPPPRPPARTLCGQHGRVEPLDAGRHAHDLFAACALDHEQRLWTYMSYGPFADVDAYQQWLGSCAAGSDPLFHAIVDLASGQATGVAAYLRIDPPGGVIEVGHIVLSPRLQRSPAATEAMYLMMRHAFELGYRRYEWKCDALNARSRAAAERLGFVFEGVFRQATVYKGRNRDTAWYSVVDSEWPLLRSAFEHWLDNSNFDAAGVQRTRLADIRAGLRTQRNAVGRQGEA